MTLYKDIIQVDLSIDEDSSILGQVSGKVTLSAGRNLQIHGSVVGNLVILSGAETFVHGIVNGDIYNRGTLFVYGSITGSIYSTPSGKVVLNPGSKISGNFSIEDF